MVIDYEIVDKSKMGDLFNLPPIHFQRTESTPSNIEEYLAAIKSVVAISRNKQIMIRLLWGDNTDSWPREYVTAKQFSQATGTVEIRKRLQELRDFCSCDIEAGNESDVGVAHRLVSPILKEPNTGEHFDYFIRKKIISIGVCNWCQRLGVSPTTKLQADHRMPYIRGGSSNFENGQCLCTHHNILKRVICSGCNKDCSVCPLAYPELHTGFRKAVLEYMI